MIEIVTFQAEHIAEQMAQAGVALDATAAKRAVMIESNPGPKYSAFLDGKCIGSGGALWIHGRVFMCWLDTTPELTKRPIAFTKLVKKLFEDFKARYNWERIEIQCRSDSFKNLKWAWAIGGFECSGEPDRKAGPFGEDVYRLSIVK